MQLLQALEQMVQTIGTQADALGWDAPAVVFSVGMTVGTETVTYTAEPLCVLDGHPVVAFLREHPATSPEAIGAALVCEAWEYSAPVLARQQAGETIPFPPSGDPDRVELRIVQLCLRDGTECALVITRDGGVRWLEEQPHGWVPFGLRRTAGAPSQAPAAAGDLPARLAALWQLGNLGVLAEQGFPLAASVDPDELARFTLPGFGVAPEAVREPWWAPVEAALAGAPFDGAAFAAGVRAAVATQEWVLPVGMVFARARDEVILDAAGLAWMDDAMLVAFIDDTVPGCGELIAAATADLGAAWGQALTVRFAALAG